MDIQSYLAYCQNRVNSFIDKSIPATDLLHEAMRYSSLNGGKRLRATLAYATGESMGANIHVLDHVSAAIEMLHAYSLIHDDLPALDDDDLRRGKPSCHKEFDEPTAILAGDSLQSYAFQMLSGIDENLLPSEFKIKIINLIARAIGADGMCGGELLDILMENQQVTIQALKHTYELKTGHLLSASIVLGALSAKCKDKDILHHLKEFGDHIGIAFQIHDDIIGCESDTTTLGKPKGSDEKRNKPTYPSLLGMEDAKKAAAAEFEQAIKHLKQANIATEKLEAIAKYVIRREF